MPGVESEQVNPEMASCFVYRAVYGPSAARGVENSTERAREQ